MLHFHISLLVLYILFELEAENMFYTLACIFFIVNCIFLGGENRDIGNGRPWLHVLAFEASGACLDVL